MTISTAPTAEIKIQYGPDESQASYRSLDLVLDDHNVVYRSQDEARNALAHIAPSAPMVAAARFVAARNRSCTTLIVEDVAPTRYHALAMHQAVAARICNELRFTIDAENADQSEQTVEIIARSAIAGEDPDTQIETRFVLSEPVYGWDW